MTDHPTRRKILKSLIAAAGALMVLLVVTWGLTQAQAFREYQRATEARSEKAAQERQDFSEQVGALQREVRRLSNLLTAKGIDPKAPASPSSTRRESATKPSTKRAAPRSVARSGTPKPRATTPKPAPSPAPRPTPRPSPAPTPEPACLVNLLGICI